MNNAATIKPKADQNNSTYGIQNICTLPPNCKDAAPDSLHVRSRSEDHGIVSHHDGRTSRSRSPQQ